ncbi:MAG TPA: winged helix DNA-binding domain-containing protein [Opitutus sp.]|nr:winged helix DNA-binding domain-containing protein [Opitutus sp.]
MTIKDVLRQRLINQHIGGDRLRTPAEIVAWLGAVQAQEYAMAKWALALRLPNAPNDTVIEESFNSGAILRTHVLRPTWHFIAPADLRWMLQLSQPRILAQMAGRHRELEVDATLVRRARKVVIKALEGGSCLSRTELSDALRRARIVAEGERLAHLVMTFELEALICSGPRIGKQFTYALADERVPPAPPCPRDDALARLAQRYFASRGPATAHDFAWWSGLTVTDARRGIASLGSGFAQESIEGLTYVFPTDSASRPTRAPLTHFLMPDYDEYGIAYQDRRALFAQPSFADRATSLAARTYNRMIVLDQQIVGCWRRTLAGDVVEIEAVPFRRFSSPQQRHLTSDAARFAAFLGLQPRLVLQRKT